MPLNPFPIPDLQTRSFWIHSSFHHSTFRKVLQHPGDLNTTYTTMTKTGLMGMRRWREPPHTRKMKTSHQVGFLEQAFKTQQFHPGPSINTPQTLASSLPLLLLLLPNLRLLSETVTPRSSSRFYPKMREKCENGFVACHSDTHPTVSFQTWGFCLG